jgi:ribose transport system permease protein
MNTRGASGRRVGGTRGTVSRRLSIGTRIISTHSLLVLLLVLIAMFSVLIPRTFPTHLTLVGILANQTVVAVLALGLMFPLATNNFDISIGYMVSLANCVGMGLQVNSGLSWELSVVIVLVMGLLIGMINGVLVAYVRIDSFIATLGSGTFLFGIANWYTKGEQISGIGLPAGFTNISSNLLGVPTIAWFTLVLAVILWIVFEHLPAGRYFYAVGANRRAADLSGIRSQRRIVVAFGMSALFASAVGLFLDAQLQIGEPTTGPDFLLPAFAAVLLGSTSVRPGRVNVWGTVVAVMLLSVAVAGLQQLGAAFYVEYLFDGAMVVVAVGAAGFVIRRRVSSDDPGARLTGGADPLPPDTASDVSHRLLGASHSTSELPGEPE